MPWERFASAHVTRLEEARRSTEEDRVDAELAAGRPDFAAELSRAMIEEEPYRERRWCQWMLALYRCGRQAEALDAYAQARSLLRDEFGVDPGATMQTLQAQILAHDPSPRLTVGCRHAGPRFPTVSGDALRPSG